MNSMKWLLLLVFIAPGPSYYIECVKMITERSISEGEKYPVYDYKTVDDSSKVKRNNQSYLLNINLDEAVSNCTKIWFDKHPLIIDVNNVITTFINRICYKINFMKSIITEIDQQIKPITDINVQYSSVYFEDHQNTLKPCTEIQSVITAKPTTTIFTTIKPTIKLEPVITTKLTTIVKSVITNKSSTTVEPVPIVKLATTVKPTTMVKPTPLIESVASVDLVATTESIKTFFTPVSTVKSGITIKPTTIEPVVTIKPTIKIEPFTTIKPTTTVEPVISIKQATTLEQVTTIKPTNAVKPVATVKPATTAESVIRSFTTKKPHSTTVKSFPARPKSCINIIEGNFVECPEFGPIELPSNQIHLVQENIA